MKKYLDVYNVKEAIRHILCLNMPVRKASRLKSIPRTTLQRYYEKILEAGLAWEDVDKLNETELNNILCPARGKSIIKREPDCAYVVQELRKRHVTRQLLWEQYSIEDPDTALSYSQFSRKIRRYLGAQERAFRKIHVGGQQVETDFAGRTMTWKDAETGKKHKAYLFVAILPCSNYIYVYACKSQKLEDWIGANIKMFEFYGGVPKEVVVDNHKAAVITPGNPPVLNRTYQEMGRHYGFVICTTRPGKPKDKGKVEGAVLIISRWIIARLRHRTFFSLDEINDAIQVLLIEINNKPFKKLEGCRKSHYEAYDKEALQPLPEAFVYSEWMGKQKVGPDYHIHIKGHYYSVPHSLVGERVEAKITGKQLQIIHLGKCIATHSLKEEIGGYTTQPEHQPNEHRAYAQLNKQSMIDWAEKVGSATVKFVEHQFNEKKSPTAALRACVKLKSKAMEKEYEESRIEAACQHASMLGSLTLTSVLSILRRKIDEIRNDAMPVQGHLPLHSNIRGADYFTRPGV